MTDKYKLVTERKSDGRYVTEVFYDGKKIDLENTEKKLNPVLLNLVSALEGGDVEILSHFTNVNKLETIIEGENLK